MAPLIMTPLILDDLMAALAPVGVLLLALVAVPILLAPVGLLLGLVARARRHAGRRPAH